MSVDNPLWTRLARARAEQAVAGLDEEARWNLLEHEVRVVFSASGENRVSVMQRETHFQQLQNLLELADLVAPGLRQACLDPPRSRADALTWIECHQRRTV